MSDFNVQESHIEDLLLIKPKIKSDPRGSFSRLFCNQIFEKYGWNRNTIQINHSVTKNKGSIRGFHFQYPPFAEKKIVICLKGKILDIGIDLRQNSKTYLKHVKQEISKKNKYIILIPEGFAHGYQTLTNNVELLYIHSNYYNPNYEGRIHYYDKRLNISWPIKKSLISDLDSDKALLNNELPKIKL